MKRSDLRTKFQEAGLEADKIDELLNYVMDQNGKDINVARNQADEEFTKMKAENEALKTKTTELTTKVDGYKDYDELKKFKELLDAGVITQEEFEAKKKQLLGL